MYNVRKSVVEYLALHRAANALHYEGRLQAGRRPRRKVREQSHIAFSHLPLSGL
jgi:hypothetical protein